MKWHYQAQLPVSAERVLAGYTDADFQLRKLAALGGDAKVLEQSLAQGEFLLRARRKVGLEVEAPAFIQKALGAGMAVTLEERWTLASRSGSVRFEFPGAPVEIHCQTRLGDNAAGCLQSYDWEIRAKVPIVAGQIERLLVADLEVKLRRESEVCARLLAETTGQRP